MSHKTTRRHFLQRTAALSAGYWIADRAAAAGRSPNERVAFACIGIEGKGASDSADAARLGDVVAICDVDAQRLAAATRRFPKAQPFADFRKLLDAMHKSIDAATISTPDHIHAPAAAMAMRRGIHCFVQKPLTHSLYEARMLARLARDNKLATQMGNQGSADSNLRRAAALLRAGVLGAVSEIHISTDRPIWPQGIERPAPLPPPKHVDWDLWLGPAPKRPYSELPPERVGRYGNKIYHPFAWRGWWDFGTGALGDIACHAMNMVFHGLDLRNPVTIQAETSGHNRDSFPAWSIITYQFAATATRERVPRPALKLVWYDGGKLPNRELFQGFRGRSRACLVIGAKGKMLFGVGPKGYELTAGLTEPEVSFPESPGHFEEFVRAIRGGEAPWSNFPDFAGPLTETVLAGNLAVWAAAAPGQGPKLQWDAANLRVVNHAGMERLIRREYRNGYEL